MSELISKESLIKSIDYIATLGGIWGKPFEAYKEAFKEFVEGMPSAEHKKGRWIFAKYHVWECSECEKNPTKGMGYVQGRSELFRYCPNCGAKMVVDDE